MLCVRVLQRELSGQVLDVIWRRLCVSMILGRVIYLFSSELLMCGGGMRSILLLPLVAKCLDTIEVCICRMFVFMTVM